MRHEKETDCNDSVGHGYDRKELKAQIDFVEALFVNFMMSVKEHMKNKQDANCSYMSKNYMDKNCGKYALKRKITLIRQELLNLEKMIERI